MKRLALLRTAALPLSLGLAVAAQAQDLQDRVVPPPAPEQTGADPRTDDEIDFSADLLEYNTDGDVVDASGDVRLSRQGERLRADKVTWNRTTGQVVAEGNIAVTNPQGDIAYGDRIELTDSLRDGVVQNMLVVLEQGGRLAAERGVREEGGIIRVTRAAYTPCTVTTAANCPKEPSWKINAREVTYDPARSRVRYKGARITLLGLTLPLPSFSHTIGGKSAAGVLAPEIRYGRVNGLEFALPYHFEMGPNRDLTITPRVFTGSLPMLQADYRELNSLGAFRINAYGTYSRRSDDLIVTDVPATSENAFRGYVDASGRAQFTPEWSAYASIRVATDRTFLRRYDISRDDRLRSNVGVMRITPDSYFAINGWAVQSLRLDGTGTAQPLALPEIDYRKRMEDSLLGGRFTFQLNSLAIGRKSGQDTQRAFASALWELRRVTTLGQEVTFSALARADVYNTQDTLLTSVVSYRGDEGFSARAIGAAAVDVKWPFIGEALGGTQRFTPRVQMVVAPHVENLSIPNEDARAVDLEDSNLFALNRFPGYDRFEDSTRFTYGLDYALDLPGIAINANVGQSYRLTERSALFPDGTGLNDRWSDFVGRTEIRFRQFVSFTHRYRIDKDGFALRRNEIDATIGSRQTYAQIGYLRLNRDIGIELEDLRDREEARVAGRVAFARLWSVFGSATVDLTDRSEDPLSLSDGFDPVRHRIGVEYEDDCLRLGIAWRRDYTDIGDARRGNSFLLTLALTNLGR
ncbi:LPS-assembly protein LptD [Sphingomonas qomolangmaensis]|uniref:LPS-assembly protein LptD n=1 Tax=Sphingomonas qomolangmaensis TaxID=2918765 RepID=A0ABY5LCI0_9SPHN|nr:LPS assembly protein LptD [Sphingomonas qomolangmaensis]UUL83494.1 LPS assembly protein LptD [Sphingomonas qomolangmaensis]